MHFSTCTRPLSLLFLFCAPAVVQAAAPTAHPYDKLPLAFERQGKGPEERFVARGNGYSIALRGGSAAIGVQPQAGPASTMSMDFAGALRVSGTAGRELPGKINYLHGNDPKQWRFGLATYDSVTYREIYPGIDVVYRGNQRQMEFDLVLRPGADPKQIRLKFGGAGDLTLDPDGSLVVHSTSGDLRIPLPVVYQETAGARETIEGRYALLPNSQVGFRLNDYDRAKPLVIDPTIVYASLIGGGTSSTYSYAIALDSSGNAYIAGLTYASDFPTANAAYSQAHSLPDGFVSKIDPTGTTLLYSTYIGGASYDYLRSIAVDSTGAAWVTGYTQSVDFPVLNAYQSTLNTSSGSSDAVVLKLSPTGALLYSTYLGSGSYGYGIAVDAGGNAYAAGYVSGTIPPTAGAYLTSSAGGYDGFVAKFNSSGAVMYSTYLGGTSSDEAYAIAVDTGGNAYVTGYSYSSTFANAPAGGAQSANAGGGDAFIAKLNATGTALGYFTFLGGSQYDIGYAIAVDAGGNAYVGGYTTSTNLPVTAGALQRVPGGGYDGFVSKLNSTGSAFSYVTYLGGSRQDYVQGLAIDGSGDAYVTGYTDSPQFPTAAAIEGGLSGNSVSLYQTTNSGTSWAAFDANLAGAVTSISPDPTPGVLVAATENGIYRTANSGQSWTQTSTLTSAYNLSRSLANSSTIYAIACCYSVYRSTDGGQTWTHQGSPSTANRIVADPANANTAYAYYAQSSSYALQKTTDGGVTWNPATSGLPSSTPNIYSMVAASDGSLYVDIYGYGVYKSTNQGASWAAVNSGLGTYLYGAPNGLAVSASNPAVLYKSSYGYMIYATTNGGASWTAASGTAPVEIGALAVSATNPSLVYAAALSGSPALYVSPDGGATWNPAGTGLGIASPSQIVSDPTSGSTAYVVAPVTTAAFVSEINPTGSGLVYSTYLGSSGYTYGYGVAVFGGGAYVTGYNYGTFPATPTAFPSGQSGYDAFVVHISGATASCTVTVSPAAQTVYSSAATLNYSVVAPSGCTWNAASNQTWATIVPGASGSGTGVLFVGLSANNTGSTRTATLTVGGQGVTIVQAPSSCSYSLNPSSVSLGASGGAIQTTISTGAGCPWSVVNNYPATVSVTSGASGTGSGTVTLNVAATAQQTSRGLSLNIGNASLYISQPGYCSYILTPPSIVLSGPGGSGAVTVSTQNGCAWTASSSNTSWLTVTSASSGMGSGTVNYTATANTGANRSTTLNIGGASVTVTETYGQAYLISTLAGGIVEPPTPAPGTSVSIPSPSAIAVDTSGNVYFPSPNLNAVFKANSSGVVTRIAGTGVAGYSGDNGPALNAGLSSPNGVTVDSLGNVYIADSGNRRIRKVNTSGIITTVAGNGTCCYSGDGMVATSAEFNYPVGVAVDTAGNMYIADSDGDRIRKVNTSGIITTVAGTGASGYSGDGNAATSAQLSYPNGVAVDAAGNLYIADTYNRRIRKVDTSGIITTVAGNGNYGYSGDGGLAVGSGVSYPLGVAVDAAGNLYIADSSNERIRKVATNGIITTVAGTGGYAYSGDGGPATSAQIAYPDGVAVDAVGNLYIADSGNSRIRAVSAAGTITTLAGGGTGDGGPAVFGSLNYPGSALSDNAGNTYIADTYNNRVRKVMANGTIVTMAGTGAPGFSGDRSAATGAQLNYPEGLALDSAGNLYIADSSNNRIRKVAANGVITTVAGNGGYGYSGDGIAAITAELATPEGLAMDSAGNLYIADSSNNRIRKVDTNGIITTVAGNGSYGYSGDGNAATSAELDYPNGVAVDSAGNLYIADTENQRIRKVAPNGIITTVAGNGNCCYSGDGGPATSAQLAYPYGVAVDPAGDLYIADEDNNRIRKVDLSGNITTIAGNGGYGFSGDGGLAVNATLSYPSSVFVDALGNVYVADQYNNAVRLLTPIGGQPLLTIRSTHSGSFTQGQNGATYTLTVSNALGAGPSGTVTVAEILPAGLTLANMSGSGWNCGNGSCTSTSSLSGGSASTIAVTVNVSTSAPAQVTNQATASGGGAPLAGAEDLTIVAPSNPPAAPVLISPANGATGVSLTPALAWNASIGATSYDVYFGASPTPPLATNTTETNYAPGALNSGATYYWSVTARNGDGGNSSGVWSFAETCVSALNPASASIGAAGGTGSAPVTASNGCGWSAQSNTTWLTITSGSSGSGNGSVNYSVAANAGTVRVGTLTVAGQTFTVTQAASVFATQSYLISTLAGGIVEPPTQAPGTSVSIPVSYGIATDSSGNVYFASPFLNAVFKADSSGVVTRIAGTGVAGYSGDGGPALSALLNYPQGVAVDSLGDIYIADTNNARIRKIATNGTITTVAGNGSCCYSGDGGQATSAMLNSATSVSVDSLGNLYIADTGNQRVRKVNTSGIIATVAGNGTCCYSGDGGPATSAQLNTPRGMVVDASGNLYIVDTNNQRIRKVDTNGIITTFAGNDDCCNLNEGGAATGAWLAYPAGVALDGSGNLYIANTHSIRKISSSGTITTLSGSGNPGFGDGPASGGQLNSPQGVAVDAGGNVYVADSGNRRIRKISAGIIGTLVGGAIGDGGPGIFGSLNQPIGVVRDSAGNTYIGDNYNHRVRKIAANGTITTVAGTGTSGYSGDGGQATSAMLNQPHGVALDSVGNLYVADAQNRVVRKITASGTITTVAGNGSCCYSGDNGQATSAQLNYPVGVAFDAAGNLYIADANSPSVRKVALNGIITTIAGYGNPGYSGDGGLAITAQLNSPHGLAVDASGNVYIADSNNQRIRKVATNGIITTVAGNGNCCYSGDGGPATSAWLDYPQAIAVDAAGYLYIADDNNRIRKVDLSGNITTIAGNGGSAYTGDGGPAVNATFRSPVGVFVDAAGNVYVADQNNNAIRLLTPAGTQPVLTIQSAHSGAFTQGQTSAAYTLTVSNASGAGPSGTVTVAEILPAGLTLAGTSGMSGAGWSCSNGSCTSTSGLSGGSTSTIAVTVNVSPAAPTQLTNVATVSGGGATLAATEDFTIIAPVSAPAAPVLISPANGATGVSLTPALSWNASTGAASYDVAFGVSGTPPVVANTTETNYAPGMLNTGATYYWSVTARNGDGGNSSGVWSFTETCVSALNSVSASIGAAGGTGSAPVTASNGCGWSAQSNTTWLTITSGSSGSGNGSVNYSVAANAGTVRVGTLTVAGQTFTVTQAASVFATQSYLISTLAGGIVEPPTPAPGTSVSIPDPSAVAVDTSGNVYFPSPNLNSVFKANSSGVVTRIAGTGVAGYSGDNGPALNAGLNSPNGVTVDSLGNVYIADSGNRRIRKVNTSGIITTVAGNGNCCYSGDGNAATSAALDYPTGVALDTAGNGYIADSDGNRIRKVNTSGIITTVAGTGASGYSGDGNAATSAQLSYPNGVAVDAAGDLYIADTDNLRIRKVDTNGIITTVAGNGNYGYSGDGGLAVGSGVFYPLGVAVDTAGNLYIADSNNERIRKVATNGIITTVAGTGGYGYSGDGGPATSAQIAYPEGVAIDAAGNLYIADTENSRIRAVSAAGTITTLAGGGTGDGGPAVFGSLNYPGSAVRDNAGNTYIADTYNNRVRKVMANGTIVTMAGTGAPGFSGDGSAATGAQLNYPEGLALDSAGNLYIADSRNQRVRKVAANGVITTIAGNGGWGYSGDGNAATSAELSNPGGLALDTSGNLYIADFNNNRIRKVDTNGIITTVAGNGGYGYSGDGNAATSAELEDPNGVTVDSAGNLYIADTENQRIRKVAPNGIITTVAGNGNCCYSGDGGPATSAQLAYPYGVAVDPAGDLYIADEDNSRIRKVDLSGNITTIAGGGGYGFSGDGGLAVNASLSYPSSVFVDALGNVYVADQNNNAIRLLTPIGGQPVLTMKIGNLTAFTQGQSASYSVQVSNATGAGPSGTVTVTEILPAGLTLAGTSGMSGTGWTCGNGSCTSTAGLSGGSASIIAVNVNVSPTATAQLTIQATVSGGGAPLAGVEDLTIVAPSSAPAAPVLISPSNAATGVSLTPALSWNASTGATSYDVAFGTSGTPPVVANTTETNYAPGALNSGAKYYWAVTAKNGVGGNASAVWSFTETCVSALNSVSASIGAAGGTGSVPVTAGRSCGWSGQSNASWLTVTSGSSGAGNGSVNYSVAVNTGIPRVGTLTVAGQTFTVTQAGSVFSAQSYLISTLAGGAMLPTAAASTSVSIPGTSAVAIDFAGNVFFPSQNLNAVFKMDPSGVVTRIAGTGVAGYSGDGGPALSAQLSFPAGVAVDSLGNVYIADTNNGLIRKVTPPGIITTVAGSGNCCYSGDGGPATSAELNNPRSVAVDSSGNLYIADTNNNRIRMVATNGNITTVAGNGNSGYSGDGGQATSAQIDYPNGIAVDSSGNLYIADTNNNRIRKVDTKGVITTLAGSTVCCNLNDGGAAIGAWLASPQSVAVDSSGNLYIADTSNNRIRMVAPNGTITTAAGNGGNGYFGDGGVATSAMLNYPAGVGVDASGNLYIADTGNQRIRELSSGTVITLVGGGTGDGGPGTFGSLNQAAGVVRDSAGNTYIADTNNNRIRKVAANGTITTVAGTGMSGFSGDGGAGTAAMLLEPRGLALDSAGNLYVADSFNNRVRKIAISGTITTVAGNGTCCYSGDGGQATAAQLNYPAALVLDAAGNLYIADENNSAIRKVALNGTITTIAGNGNWGYSGDGNPATSAQLNHPAALAMDAAGNLYIADTNNQRIRKITTGGTITTVAGNGSMCCNLGDGGPATSAQLNNPSGVAVDAAGYLYIADTGEQLVRKVDLSGTITTIAGSGYGYSGDGGLAVNANFENPAGVFVDASGNVYVADLNNNAIRLLTPTGTQPVLTIQSTHSGAFTQGQNSATYSVTASNAAGAGPTSGTGTVTVTEILPPGLTLVNMSGAGWTCGGGTCRSSNAVSGGSSYPAIAVTVNVAQNAPAQLTNLATVSGGGSPVAGTGDLTVVSAATPELTIVSEHTGRFVTGQTIATYTLIVSNRASAPATSGTVTVTDTLPTGLTLGSLGGTGWSCVPSTYTCTRADILNPGSSYPPITVTVSVASSAPAHVTNLASVSLGALASAGASDLTSITEIKCAVNGDLNTDVTAVQYLINEALGLFTANDDLNKDGTVNLVDVQIEMNAALNLGCRAQ